MTGHAATDSANVVLLVISYPATLTFVLAYGLTQPWWRTWWGRALLVSQTSLSALLAVNLAYRLWDWSLLAREGWLRVCVYAFITAGAWLTLLAFLHTVSGWKQRRNR